ncbi:MAG: hypothetical protein R3F62_01840 [Planctomycetota bacterium]
MVDERLRRSERLGDARVAALRQRLRSGDVRAERLALAAALGDGAAGLALGRPPTALTPGAWVDVREPQLVALCAAVEDAELELTQACLALVAPALPAGLLDPVRSELAEHAAGRPAAWPTWGRLLQDTGQHAPEDDPGAAASYAARFYLDRVALALAGPEEPDPNAVHWTAYDALLAPFGSLGPEEREHCAEAAALHSALAVRPHLAEAPLRLRALLGHTIHAVGDAEAVLAALRAGVS